MSFLYEEIPKNDVLISAKIILIFRPGSAINQRHSGLEIGVPGAS